MTQTPVEFVEDGLDAHKVWKEVQEVTNELDEVGRGRDALSAKLRFLRGQLEERELEIADKIRAENVDLVKPLSEAAFAREHKTRVAHDGECKATNEEISDMQAAHDSAVGRARTLEFRARALTARMNNISQMLNFYAACKSAETEARRQQVTNPATRWPF